jgi:hypothetical protein
MSVNETKTQEKELLEQQIVSKLCWIKHHVN